MTTILRRFFLNLSPLFDVPDGVLPPAGGGVDPAPVSRERRTNCEFCECRLNAAGEALSLSDKARKFRDQAEKIATLERDLTAVTSKLDAANARITELVATPAAKRAGVALVG